MPVTPAAFARAIMAGASASSSGAPMCAWLSKSFTSIRSAGRAHRPSATRAPAASWPQTSARASGAVAAVFPICARIFALVSGMKAASRTPIARSDSSVPYRTDASWPRFAGSLASCQGASLSMCLFPAETSSQSEASARWVENSRTCRSTSPATRAATSASGERVSAAGTTPSK